MTMTEKILARAAGKESVAPGDLIMAKVDFCLGNDITAPVAIDEFEKAGFDHVFDPERIALIPDHFTPNKDIKSAGLVKQMREFSRKHGLTHWYDVGRVGVEHAFLPEQGLVGPGDVVLGADSHTCTYGALGAFATGVGSTDLAGAMATGEAWFRVPETHRFDFEGELGEYVTGKDIVLFTIGQIGWTGRCTRPWSSRARPSGACPWTPASPSATWLSSRREERHHRTRRHHKGLCRRPFPAAAALLRLRFRRMV
jgi:3-isopropylmalate/(R)-2-methylmalate dehydratase large subunit